MIGINRIVPLILFVGALNSYELCAANEVDSYPSGSRQNYPDQLYWGDTHLHSSLSMDAYLYGNRLGPAAAYRFARGEKVRASSGQIAKLKRPLDFLVIADHASNMGVMQGLAATDETLIQSPLAKRWLDKLSRIDLLLHTEPRKTGELIDQLFLEGFEATPASRQYRQSVWDNSISIAEAHNQPGKFTTLIGYEWTQWYFNLHRVVIFKDGADKVGQTQPFSQLDGSDPEALWQYFEDYEKLTGGQVLAIPHNGNLSRGVMFALETASGKSLSRDYARRRSHWEPLFEVTQIKGDSETHPFLSMDDDFANFERITSKVPYAERKNNLGDSSGAPSNYDSWVSKNRQLNVNDWTFQYEYARSGLKLGISQFSKLGINPFKFGMIGSTDMHTSLSSVDNDNFWGTSIWTEPNKRRIFDSWDPNRNVKDIKAEWGKHAWTMNAAGLTAVWAAENTREQLFDAMMRKEVYATTGPRIRVRFFGGWDYEKSDAFKPDFAHVGYGKGVPMGGDLSAAPADKSATFLIRAVKDPEGANLDRIQIIKGWQDRHGKLHEKIYNVALADERIDQGVKTKSVGNTVDISDASYSNSIGDPELVTVWRDPDFRKDELAFYYLRVLEIPTPRWTAHDAKYYKLTSIPDGIPMITQERAYTSPIWYTPADTYTARESGNQ